MQVILKLVHEPWPDERWRAFFARVWPLYQRWYLAEGDAARPDAAECLTQLRAHMPELLPVYARLCELGGHNEVANRFLSMWCPPPYMAGCSVLALADGHPTLIRNYDFDPRFFDGRLTSTEYCKPVIGMQDSAWGLLDGMNADGLAVALSFGGRKVTGRGFGIPLVLRYVLETCSNTTEACAVLSRLPVHMCYNVMALDASGHVATVYLNPDRPAEVMSHTATTNHQHQVEWDEHAAFTKTRERLDCLKSLVAAGGSSREAVLQQMLKPPLHSKQYLRGFGTLYTCAYDVTALSMKVVWPDRRVEASFRIFEEQEAHVTLLRPAGRYMAK